MTAPRARAPKVTDLNWSQTLPSNFDATIDAACADAISAFTKAAGRTDGERSRLVAVWTAEILRVASAVEEVAAA